MPAASQQYFIKILCDFLNDRKSVCDNSVDWEMIAELGTKHQVSGIIYHQCKTFIPDSIGLGTEYARQLYCYAQNKYIEEELDELLEDKKHLFIKGLKVAALYPVPELRSMGDLDLLVQTTDRTAVEEILKSHGYCFNHFAESVGVFHKNGVMVEVHNSLIHSGIGNEKARVLFSNPWEKVIGGELDWSYHLLFLLQHLEGHLISRGVGIRQFMDIAVVVQNKTVDWKWLKKTLTEANMFHFAERVFSLIHNWFGVAVPEMYVQDEAFLTEATEKVLADGVFGYGNSDNSNTGIAKQILYSGGPITLERAKYLLRESFPEYRKMCSLPYCRYIKKSELLLPVAWGHRILHRVFDKNSRQGFVDRTMISDERIKRRTEMFSKWGIEG